MARIAALLALACLALCAAPSLAQPAATGFPVSSYLNVSNIPSYVTPPSGLTLILTLYGVGTQQYLCGNESTGWVQQSPFFDLYAMTPNCDGPWAAVPAACSLGASVGKFYTLLEATNHGPGTAALMLYNPLTIITSTRVNVTTDLNDTLGIPAEEWNLQTISYILGANTTGAPYFGQQTTALTGGAIPTGFSIPNLPNMSNVKYWMRGFPQGGDVPPFACLENQRVDVPAKSYFLFWAETSAVANAPATAVAAPGSSAAAPAPAAASSLNTASPGTTPITSIIGANAPSAAISAQVAAEKAGIFSVPVDAPEIAEQEKASAPPTASASG